MEYDKLLYFPNFCLTALVNLCQPFIVEPLQRWKTVKKTDRLSCCKGLIKLADTVRIVREPSNIPSCSHCLRFSPCKWSLDGRPLPRPPAETVVGVQGRTWMRTDQGNSFLLLPAVALGGLWNSLGWTCWEVTTFPFSSSITLCVSSSLWQIRCLSLLY